MNCITESCPRSANKENLCDPCREDRNRDNGVLCGYPPCARGAIKSGLCSSHYSQKRRGDELKPLPRKRKENATKGQDGLPVHGTSARYNIGCKCPECTQFKANENIASTARHKAKHGVHPVTAYRARVRKARGYWPQGWGGDFISPPQREALYERDGWVCQLCGGPVDKTAPYNHALAPTLDHITPQSWGQGPDHSPGNLQTAHRGCNARKGNRSITLAEA